MNAERQVVLWFGPPPSTEVVQEFTHRDLVVVTADPANLQEDQFVGARGAIYHFAGQDIGTVRQAAASTVSAAVDHGLMVYFLAQNDTIQSYLPTLVAELGIRPAPLSKTATPAYRLAETLARYNPGRSCRLGLKIEPGRIARKLKPAERLLLRRAFSDCTHIHLAPLTPGRTASVYVVHATFVDSLVGPRPLPFFAKLGPRDKIEREIGLYELYATHFIPFHLRPNLDPSRCILGRSSGILIGNFVDRSESLADLARRGQANPAIHALFDVTLGAWRAQAYVNAALPATGPIAGALRSTFDYTRVRPEHRKFADDFGVNQTPQALWEFLIGLGAQCYRRAPMHGDMHGENVRVRQGDAILIDLASVSQGPLAADPASLETSLVFETDEDDSVVLEDIQWRDLVDSLYAPEAFDKLPPPRFEVEPMAAMWNSARQVRMIALPTQACPSEYATAIVVYLLRRTMYAGDGDLDRLRRGYAYVTAARLIEHLRKEHVTP